MTPNNYAQIAEKQWHWLGEQYPYVVLHAFVVMPNHIHGIIEINRSHMIDCNVGTGRDLSLQQRNGNLPLQNGALAMQQPTIPKIKSLSEIIGAYKTTVSKQIHGVGFSEFVWQRSFHDHIIRNETSYQNIIYYILNNPSKWEEDELYSNGK